MTTTHALENNDPLFDPALAAVREGERIEKLLGPLATKDYEYALFKEHAQHMWVPLPKLLEWWRAYQKNGQAGLQPRNWKPLDAKTQEIVRNRLALLGDLTDEPVVTKEHIFALGPKHSDTDHSRDRTNMRIFRRYRIGGVWGLAPQHNPEKKVFYSTQQAPRRAVGTLDKTALAEIEHRYALIGDDLARQVKTEGVVSRDAVKARAIQVGCSEKTLWNYLAEYRRHGLAGLAPKQRSDKGVSHGISPRMRKIVLGLRLMRRKQLRVRAIHHEACIRARELGEPEPSEWQVRMICASIAKPDTLLSEGEERKFKDKYGITYTMAHADARNPQMVLEIDPTQIDVLAKDMRSKKYQKKSGEVRPWLTLAIERRSRLIMAAIFSYDRPDQYTIAAAIREAIRVYSGKPYGGIPDIILVDNGKELLSHHVQHITQELHIILRPCIRHQPQQKGKVERTFGTLNTRLWSTLDGYVDSDVTKRNPHAKAKYTIAELEAKLREYIQKYHREVHSQLHKRTPLQYWVENCYAEPMDVRRLDALLTKAEGRKAEKTGIQYRNRVYWSRAIGSVVGKHVLIRAIPSYAAPDEIEVFYGDRWVCTADAIDSEKGKAVTVEEVREAQHEQRQQIRQRIHEARDAVAEADAEIAHFQQKQGEKSEEAKPSNDAEAHSLPSVAEQPQYMAPKEQPQAAQKEEPQGKQNSKHPYLISLMSYERTTMQNTHKSSIQKRRKRNNEMQNLYDEDQLPEGQLPIQTSNVKALQTFMDLLTDPKRLYPTIGVVIAWAGEGKTIAAQYCQDVIEARFQGVLPVTIKVKVPIRATSRSVLLEVLKVLGERSKSGDNASHLAEEVAVVIRRYDLRLIIFDEADRLNDDSFEAVRHLLDKTGCPILLVGLPNLVQVIKRHDKFDSRACLQISFQPLSLDEVLNVVLPGLVYERWSFHSNDTMDRAMGEDIWRKVSPNLRKLRSLLDTANIVAIAQNQAKITLPLIQSVYTKFMSPEDQYHIHTQKKAAPQTPVGSHEDTSEQRHQAKEHKKEGRKADAQ